MKKILLPWPIISFVDSALVDFPVPTLWFTKRSASDQNDCAPLRDWHGYLLSRSRRIFVCPIRHTVFSLFPPGGLGWRWWMMHLCVIILYSHIPSSPLFLLSPLSFRAVRLRWRAGKSGWWLDESEALHILSLPLPTYFGLTHTNACVTRSHWSSHHIIDPPLVFGQRYYSYIHESIIWYCLAGLPHT